MVDHQWVKWTVICVRLTLKMVMRYWVESQLSFLVTLANCHLWETALCIQTNHQHIIQFFMQKTVICLSLVNSLALEIYCQIGQSAEQSKFREALLKMRTYIR